MRSRLSDKQLQVARTEAAKPLNVSFSVRWGSALYRSGWCIYLNYENIVCEATFIAGPFDTRDEAEEILRNVKNP